MGRRYRVGEVAELTGVSVRTLHHYDQIGVLRPSVRSEGGHRLYGEVDLLRLQQILTLRYLGFALREAGALLDRPDFDLVASLRIQQLVLRDRIAALERIDAALAELLDRRLETGRWNWSLAAAASAAVHEDLAHSGEQMESVAQLYTPEQMKQFEELGRSLPPETVRRMEEDWTALLADVRAGRGLDPASAAARALADRWNTLSAEMAEAYRAYPDLWAAIGRNYQAGAFEEFEKAPGAEDFTFIQRVNAARA